MPGAEAWSLAGPWRLSRRSRAGTKIRRKASFFTSVGVCAVILAGSAVNLVYRRFNDQASELDIELDAIGGHRRLDGLHSVEHRRLGDSLYPVDPIIGTQPYKDADRRYLCFFHVIVIFYMLLGLNTVCDVYFTGALDVMVEKWNIKPDVAGATFMAAGGSAPELFTSLTGSCIAQSDVGFGAIVGSAVFNVLFVIGLCGFAAKEPIKLTWWPLFRDCTFYVIGLSLLAICASDQFIEIWEAAILFLGYIVYCIFMYNNDKLEKYTDKEFLLAKSRMSGTVDEDKTDMPARKDQVVPVVPTETPKDDDNSESNNTGAPVAPLPEDTDPPILPTGTPCAAKSNFVPAPPAGGMASNCTAQRNQRISMNHMHGKMHAMVFVGHCAAQRHDQRMASIGAMGSTASHPKEPEGPPPQVIKGEDLAPDETDKKEDEDKNGEEEEEDDECENLMQRPEDFKERILWYFSLPIYAPLYYMTPTPDERWFLVSFGVSLLWIALFTFLMVWYFEILGKIMGIPDLVMGLTVIAAGTSIPDAASSLAVARMGEGDMAVSSSIGSNIFDILVGLPIPWMVKIGIIELGDFKVPLTSDYLTFYVILLLIMVLLVVLSIHFLGWVLNRTLGVCMAALYAIFLVLALSVESLKPTWLKF